MCKGTHAPELIRLPESTLVKCVKAHAHAPELIRHPAHTFVSSVSREHTQLCTFHCKLRYLRFQLDIMKLVDNLQLKCTFMQFAGVIPNN